MSHQGRRPQAGYTIVELVLALFIMGIVALSIFTLFTALVNSSLLMKRKGVALSLATSQMEYLKSLPYDLLAVSGGSIVATSYLPASTQQTLSGVKYTITTSINYADEAYDGCGSYPTVTLKQKYCRNYPAPASAPATDTNAADTKVIHVKVSDLSGRVLSDVDTQIAARVAETASNTGAIFVTVVDETGNPVEGANVNLANTTITPNVNVNDTTDQNGVVIFYGMPPDNSNYDYKATASLNGFSTLSTLPPSGTLQATYSNVQVLSQQSSSITMQLRSMLSDSLVLETTDTSGVPLANVKLHLKGGYKKYTATTDTTYYYDTMSPSDTRPVSDAGGFASVTNLVPGPYYVCGDAGATSCAVGGTAYYLAAAIPYGGTSALSPTVVPTSLANLPTFSFNSSNYAQKVRLMLTTSSTFPRLTKLTPNEASLSAANIAAFPFQLSGANLPCGATPAACTTIVRLKQGGSTFTASCIGSSNVLNCTVNLSAATLGATTLEVVANGTLTLPAAMPLGGINVVN